MRDPSYKNGRSLVPCGKRALVEKWKALAWLEGWSNYA
jgi:hypothetical protein